MFSGSLLREKQLSCRKMNPRLAALQLQRHQSRMQPPVLPRRSTAQDCRKISLTANANLHLSPAGSAKGSERTVTSPPAKKKLEQDWQFNTPEQGTIKRKHNPLNPVHIPLKSKEDSDAVQLTQKTNQEDDKTPQHNVTRWHKNLEQDDSPDKCTPPSPPRKLRRRNSDGEGVSTQDREQD